MWPPDNPNKVTIFFLNMIIKEKTAPFFAKGSRFPKWCPTGAVSVPFLVLYRLNQVISQAVWG